MDFCKSDWMFKIQCVFGLIGTLLKVSRRKLLSVCWENVTNFILVDTLDHKIHDYLMICKKSEIRKCIRYSVCARINYKFKNLNLYTVFTALKRV